MFNRTTFACLALISGLAASAVPAQEPAAQDSAALKAHSIAMARLSPELTSQQLGVLNLIAYASAAANVCDDLQLDEAAVYGALTATTYDAADEMTEAEKTRHRDFALIAFGVLTGQMVSEAVRDDGFCGTAVAFANSDAAQTFLLQNGAAVQLPADAPAEGATTDGATTTQ
jgi:hypothetical protein